MLLEQRKYTGRIVDEPSGERNSGLICLEEPAPRETKSAEIFPRYIANLATYTERECRSLIREVALIIKQSHDNGMAHRNLLLTNLLVDRAVRATVSIRVL
jgi:serine/threonine protein kinase